MGSYKLITENKRTLYYDKYEYKVKLKIKGIGRARFHTNLESFTKRIKELQAMKWIDSSYKVTANDLKMIDKFLSWKTTVSKPKMTYRVDTNSLTVYANDLKALESISKLFDLAEAKFVRAHAVQPSGVIYFKRTPPTNYRVYFKFGKVENNFYGNLKELIERYKDSNSPLVPSKSLYRWLNKTTAWYTTYVSSSFSIGYNNESDLLLLKLTIPEALGQHFKLEKSIDA